MSSSRASIDSRRCSLRWNSINALSNENLDNLHNMVPLRNNSYSSTGSLTYHYYSDSSCSQSSPSAHSNYANNANGYSHPITFSKFPYRHQHARRTHKFDVIKQTQPKGLIFVWPQKRNFYYEREYTLAVRILAQLLYWLTEMSLFPSGSGLPIKKPPWSIQTPIPKPENRDYIIEPDWNSIYYDT